MAGAKKPKSYNPRVIEKKWQKYWFEHKFYQAIDSSSRARVGRKFYALVEFPYPSGEGLHVGHIRSYTALDILARKRRAEGLNVLYPMGWDAFGLPTENYAIKIGQAPAVITKRNINRYRRQLQSLGFSFDWSREINTSDPNYYRYTQWLFLQLFKAGLAYKKRMPINWCFACKIGLANEEVVDGKCERCGGEVEKREKEQWMLAITKYADRLDKDLELVDYPEPVKLQQRHWIGRKDGWEIEFQCVNSPTPLPKGEGVPGYHTTDAATWYALQERVREMRQHPTEAENLMWQILRKNSLGCHFRRQQIIGKFVVDFVCLTKSLVVEVDGDIHDYQRVEDAERTRWLEASGYQVVRFRNEEIVRNTSSVRRRLAELLETLPFGEGRGGVLKVFTTRPETIFGVSFIAKYGERDRFTGEYAINPASGEAVPIWEAEYVMGEVGTGVIMGVPAHDERDREFAKKYGIPFRETVVPIRIDKDNPPREGYKKVARQVIHAIIKNPKTEKILLLKWKKFPWTTLVIGGVEERESVETAARREILEETGYKNLKLIEILGGQVKGEFFAAHKNENRVAYTTALVFELIDDTCDPVLPEEAVRHEVSWGTIDDVYPCAEIDVWKDRLSNGVTAYIGEGELINSGPFSGRASEEARDEIIKFVGGKKMTTYKLRDWIFSRQRYWGEPIPLIYCEKDGRVPVSEKDLPVKLPLVKKYQPTDTGESPLAAMKRWVKTKCPTCGGPARRETDTMPNWAGSSWYYLAYLLGKDLNSKTSVAKQFSADKVQSRFKHWLPVDWYNGGMEHTTLHLLYSRFWHKAFYDLGLVPGVEPYAKRTAHGLVLAKDGEKMSKSRGNVINPDEIIERFGADTLRVYEMFMGPFEQAIGWGENGLVGVRRFLERVWKLIDKDEDPRAKSHLEIGQALEQTVLKVSQDIETMKFNTAVSTLMIMLNSFDKAPAITRSMKGRFLQLLAPFAPHLAEELWWQLGNKKSIFLTPWPRPVARQISPRRVRIVIQINGKRREVMEAAAGLPEGKLKALALAQITIRSRLAGKKPVRIIVVPNRLINIVIT